MKNKIYGSGGGGKSGGGQTPSESPDSLRSRQKARIVEIISEGEIEGLVDGLKSVYLNDVPIQNANGTYNFEGVTLVTAVGTPVQDYIPGFNETESEHQVGVEVQYGSPYVFQIPNRASSGADAVRVTIGVAGLSHVQDDGNITGTSVAIQIEVQHAGGGYAEKVTDVISGKTTSRYQRNYRIQLPQDQDGPWDVRVTRLTIDSNSAKLVNNTSLDTYTIISETKMRFTNSAVVGLEIDAEQFPNVPTRGYHGRGIKIRLPSNYDPTTRTYTGIWDGTFQAPRYSNNPAWVLYDLLTEDRYGLGKYIDPSLVDIWTLYTIGQYCDELVPDGYGGMEPRYTCNLYIQERSEAFTLIANIASIAHAATYGSGGGIAFVQDAPRDPIALYSPANVIDGKFEYTGTSIKAQHNVVLVAWNDPADKYRQKIEYVEDAESIAKYGIVQKEVVAMGCTSRGQARRFGRAVLYAEKYEGEGISFAAGLDSCNIYPGAVFKTADPVRTQVRNGGRLLSSTLTSVVLDSPVDITDGIPHTITVIDPNGNVVTRDVTSSGEGLTQLGVTPAFEYAPVSMAMWVLESTDKLTEEWVCLTAEENPDNGNIQITGLAYDVNKFPFIEADTPLPPTPEYNPYLSSPPPTNLAVSAYLNALGGVDVLVSWEPASGTRYATLTWRRDDENFETAPPVYSNTFTIRNASVGQYTFIVSTINAAGLPSPGVPVSYNVASASVLPDVTGLNLKQPFLDSFASFEWDKSTTADSYKTRILVDNVPVRETIVTDNWFTYDFAESVADGGGTPFRAFTLQVKARYGLIESGNWTSIDVSNPAPGIPALSVLAITGGFQASAPLPGDSDYKGMVVWASDSPGFTPSALNQVYDGQDNSVNILDRSPGIPVYVRAAFYDTFGKTNLNISPEYSVTPLSNVADIDVVNTLPTTGLFEGKVVYLTTDKKLYRYTTDGLGGTTLAWHTWVDGSDILTASVTAGQIFVDQLSAIAANMGTITAGNITLDTAGFIKGGSSDYRTGYGFWMGYNGSNYKFSMKGTGGEFVFDGTGITLYDALGNTVLTATGGVPYSSVSGTPTSLSDINSSEATKLSGIDAGATRNAYMGAYNSLTQYEYGDVVTKDGSAWTYFYGTPTTGNAPPTLPTVSNTWWGLYAAQGPAGDAGVNGTRTAILEMYKASSTVPTTFPSGDSTYTWSTGQFTDPSTLNGWSRTPPTPGVGELLYVVRQLYADQNTTTTSTVTWSATTCREVANGVDGTDGTNGWRTAVLELYKWSATTPATFPSGSSTYTWADGSFTAPATPNGWSLTPGAAVAGQTLWACSTVYADQGVTTTSSVTWSAASAYAIGAAGTNGANAKLAVLTASSHIFRIDQSSVATPSSITLTAYGQNVTGSPTFTVTSGTASLIGTGNTRTLSEVGLTTESATIKITWDGQEDFVTIAKVREGLDGADGSTGAAGVDGLTVVMTNEAHTLPANTSGSVTSYANSGTLIQVYEGITALTAGGSANGSFTVGTPVQSPAASITAGSVVYGGTTATIGVHSAMSTSADVVTLTYPITVKRLDGSTVVIERVQTLTKSKAGATGATGPAGADGSNGVTAILTNEAHVLPALSTGVVTSYTGSGTAVQVYEGATMLVAGGSANGSFTVGAITQSPAGSMTVGGVTYAGNTATIANHSAMSSSIDLVTLTIPVTVKRLDGSIITFNRVQTVAKSKAGADGLDGADGAGGPSVVLTPSRSTAFTSTDGTLDPLAVGVNENITFNAAVSGISNPTYVWTFAGFESSPANSGTNALTVTRAQFGNAKSATVTCTVNGLYKDVVTIVRLEKSTAAAGADNTTNALTSGVTITAGGLKGGATDFLTGPSGFFLGYSSGLYKLSVHNTSNGQYFGWNGSALEINAPQFIMSGGLAAFGGTLAVKSAASGARMEIYNNTIRIYDENNVERVRLGDLSVA